MKERNKEIKNKIIKVINIIAYISLGLILLLCLLVGINSCDNKTTNKPVLETHLRINNNVDTLYGRYTYFDNSFNIQFYNFNTFPFAENGLFNETYKSLIEFSQIETNVGRYDIAIQYLDVNNTQLDYVYLHNVKSISKIDNSLQYIIDYGNNQTYYLDFSYTDLFRIRFMLTPIEDLQYNLEFFKYCSNTSIYQNNVYLSSSLHYYIPIYQTIDIGTEPYNINLSFELAKNVNRRYYCINYNRGVLTFKYFDKTENTNGEISLKPTLSKNGQKYIFKLTDLYGINQPTTKIDLFNRIYFETFAFGKEGFIYINNNYIYSKDNIIEGEMYFSPNMAYDYLLEYINFEYNAIFTNEIDGYFIIGGSYYTKLRATLESNVNSRSYNFRLVALNGNNETITIFNGYKNNDVYGWNNETLIANSELYFIRYTDVIYNENTMWAFYNYLFVDTYESGIIGGNDTYIGDTFILIGSSFSALTSILGISILPGITIGMLFFVPFIVSIVLFVIWLFKR